MIHLQVLQSILTIFSLLLFTGPIKHDQLVSPINNLALEPLQLNTNSTSLTEATTADGISILPVSFKETVIEVSPSSTPTTLKVEISQKTPLASSTPIPNPLPSDPPRLEVSSPTPITETAPIPQASSSGLDADKIFSMVNAHRASLNLAAFQKDDRSCQLAASRAPEVEQEIERGTMHKGMYDRDLPYWNTENIVSMDSEQAAFNWWVHDYIHKVAIEGPYKYSCVACLGNSCVEEFTNFLPK